MRQMQRIREDVIRTAKRRHAANIHSGSKHGKPFRPEALVEIEQACRQASLSGCIRREIQHVAKSFSVSSVWIVPGIQHACGWDDGEEELSFILLSDAWGIDRYGDTNGTRRVLGVISLHAIGRWFSRAFAATNEALMADLLVVTAYAEHGERAAEHEFRLGTSNGGSWIGYFCPTNSSLGSREELQLQVRTFF